MKRNSTSETDPISGRSQPIDPDRYAASRYRVLQRVAPGLTHELRGPLNALSLNVELLKMTQEAVDEKGVEKRKRYVSVVGGELNRFQDLFERFLEQVLGTEKEDAERFDLRELVGEVHELVSVQVRKEGVRLSVESPEDPLPVAAVRGRVRQALLICMVSALDALGSAPGSAKTLTLSVDGSEGAARVCVVDSSPAASRSEGGAGATSLELARTLAESQGARWSFGDAGDGGSEVRIEIPLAGGLF
jgi:signal transduction histidine kinase